MDHSMHEEQLNTEHSAHDMSSEKMTFWQKFKMSMTMTMGMDHTGLAGREMAKMMEIDNKLPTTLRSGY